VNAIAATHPNEQDGETAMNITLYTKPGCVQCRATARQFDKADVRIQTVDVSVDTAAAQLLEDLGFRSVPVVIADGQSWAGHRPDRVDAVIRQKAEAMSCPRL
jgi:glutaredoxin-like protein NrdH